MTKKILVVEDDTVIRAMTLEFLEDAGFLLEWAETADAALEILQAHASEICLLFTDVRMPGTLDGLDLARHVIKRWPRIKVIVTSGMFNRSQDVVPDGAEFLAKPWMPLDMLMMVSRAAASACQ